jgi:hypothetical protein
VHHGSSLLLGPVIAAEVLELRAALLLAMRSISKANLLQED